MPQISSSTTRLILISMAVGGLLFAAFCAYRSQSGAEDRKQVSNGDVNAAIAPTTVQKTANAQTEAMAHAMPSTESAKRRAARIATNVEAPASVWPTEAFSEDATQKLKKLAKGLAEHGSDCQEIASLITDSFRCGVLRPEPQKTSETNNFQIAHWAANDQQQTLTYDSLASALSELFNDRTPTRMAFKIVRVARAADGYRTQIHVEGGNVRLQPSNGTTVESPPAMQWTANWDCEWTKDAKLKSVRLQDYQEIASKSDAEPWLSDVAPQVLSREASYQQQLQYGMDYWVNRIEHRFYPNRLGHHGLAIGDVNGDGLEDLYVCQPGGLPNRLYLHQQDGSAIDGSSSAGVDALDDTTAALLADLDNDGDQDLALLTISGGYIFSNNGQGQFTLQVTLPDCRNAFSLTAADYNQDGRLDLYVGRYWPDESVRGAIPLPVPYYDATNGGSNLLLRNDGDWSFSDVTQEVGLDHDNTRYTMAAAWEDFDNDGDQDLYVANDFGRNCLYRNDRGRFVNVAAEFGVEDTAAGMSVSWADIDHDGRQDLYVGNMFSSAGGRITYQSQYADRFDAVAQQKLQRLARGNSLFRNDGKQFTDISDNAKATMGRWAWGSMFVDLNNDSWDDIVVANGHVTTEDTGDL